MNGFNLGVQNLFLKAEKYHPSCKYVLSLAIDRMALGRSP